MEKVFIEYRIKSNSRESFLHFIEKMKSMWNIEVWEGTDQPNLFVEIWSEMSYEAYKQLKKDRIQEVSIEWQPLVEFVEGGAKKMHVWHFTCVK